MVRPGRFQLSLQDPDLADERKRATSPCLLQKAAVKALLREALDLRKDRWGEPIISHEVPSR
jgi:hypothetical protein